MFREIKRQGEDMLKLLGYTYDANNTVDAQPLLIDIAQRAQNSTMNDDAIRTLLAQLLDRGKIRTLSLYSNRKVTANFAEGNFSTNATKSGDELRKSMNVFFRGQLRDTDVTNPSQMRWELNGQENTDENYYFNSALFPAILRWTEEGGHSRVLPIPFRVCYSSHEPTWMNYQNMVANSVNPERVMLLHKPDWVAMKLRPDPSINSGGVGNSVTINVDRAYIADNNAALSIMASLQNSFPVNGSYIYMYPDVVKSEYLGVDSPLSNPRNSKVSGASLGMAVFAAVSGWPPYMYTGYIPYPAPGYKLQGDQVYRGLVNAAFHRTNPGFYQKAGPDHTAIRPGFDVAANALVKVSKQLNFVETVADLQIKMAFAMSNGFPLICPASTSLGEATASVLNRVENVAFFRTYLQVLPEMYTMSMAQDGDPAAKLINGKLVLANVYLGSTVTEFLNLASIINYYNNIIDLAPFSTTKDSTYQKDFVTALLYSKQQMGQKSAALFQEIKQEREQLDTLFKEKKIDKDQWINDMRKARTTRRDKTNAKKEVKKAKDKADTLKKAQIRDRIAKAAEAYKKSYEEEKLNLGPAPTKQELSAFFRKWKKPQNVKKQLNKKMFKDVFGDVLLMPRPGMDPAAVAAGKRKAFIRRLIEAKMDAPAIVSAVNNIYGSSVNMIPSNTDLNTLVEMSTQSTTRPEQPKHFLGDKFSIDTRNARELAKTSAVTEDAATGNQLLSAPSSGGAVASNSNALAIANNPDAAVANPNTALVVAASDPFANLMRNTHTQNGEGTANSPFQIQFNNLSRDVIRHMLRAAINDQAVTQGPSNTIQYKGSLYKFVE